MINIPHCLKRRFRISDIHARVGGRRAPPPAPPGMKGAHADGVLPSPARQCPLRPHVSLLAPQSQTRTLPDGRRGHIAYAAAAPRFTSSPHHGLRRAHIGVGHSKTPSGAQGRPAGDSAARASSRPGRIGRDGGALRRGNRAGTPVPAPPGCGGSSTRMGGKAPAVTIARAGKTPTALRNPPARRNKSARIRTFP